MRSLKASRWLLLALLILAIPAVSQAQVFVSVRIGPPPLPVYVQPVIPAPGYIWVPGYWAYGPGGYYWVPGTWVEPPEVGLLWTPGYWGWAGGLYVWHGGYWGPHVGFYGGINYGFGYTGVGYSGGYWRGREFYYNRAVTNVNVTIIHNTYERQVVYGRAENRAAFNGGPGGVVARPTSGELVASREHHFQATGMQTRNQNAASTNRAMFASENHGRPAVAATARAGVFKGSGVEASRPGGAERPALGGANSRNAESFHSQPGTAKSSASTGRPHAQPGYQAAPGYKATPAYRAAPAYGSHPAGVQPQHQGVQQQRQFQQHQAPRPQEHQAQQQPHQGQQHPAEQHEGKPHKPRN
jgi:WXXGXW repeat (2 copies)